MPPECLAGTRKLPGTADVPDSIWNIRASSLDALAAMSAGTRLLVLCIHCSGGEGPNYPRWAGRRGSVEQTQHELLDPTSSRP